MTLDILYCDEDLVAVHKTSGLLVHRTSIDRHADAFALQIVRDQVGAKIYPVHRLDRPTSGVLLFARSPEMASQLAADFQFGRVQKTYLAIVRGIPKESSCLIDYPLKEEYDRKADPRTRKDKPAQSAQTKVRTLAQCQLPVQVDRYPTTRYSLVEAQPLTGRRHQIRRHLRHLGHPIIGDVTHGSGKHNRFFMDKFGFRRMYLACTALGFKHPQSQEPMVIKAPPEENFRQVVRELGWSDCL